ncbi:MAG: nicotinate-nucleotide adenylyltransferase [Ignavibacteria bacterium]|nr:nicotinate-nucleotide adenylyltransferase [Ignavibacteria bacterium]
MQPKKIGVFGGSFNPPHIAHKIAAEFCRDELGLDLIIVIPAGNHPLKESADAHHRLAMTRLAFGGDENFRVSDIEAVGADEKNYTVDTLQKLRIETGKEAELCLLIGADNLIQLPKWKEPERLFELAEVAVMLRPGADISDADEKFLSRSLTVNIPQLEISSSEIRNRIAQGRSVKYMTDEAVLNYIREHGLYK